MSCLRIKEKKMTDLGQRNDGSKPDILKRRTGGATPSMTSLNDKKRKSWRFTKDRTKASRLWAYLSL